MSRLVAITFNLSKTLKRNIFSRVKEQIQIELTFSNSDVYLINNSNKEVQYLNILHDVCCNSFDIDKAINGIINDDLFYEDRTIINNIGSYGTTELVDINGKTFVKKRPKAYYPTMDEEYRFMERLYSNNREYFVKVMKDDYSDSYIMELAINSLSSFVKERPTIDVFTASSIINDILDELDYIHKIGYIHNDLHADNILLFETEDKKRWKILDFGMSYNLIENKFVISELVPASRHTDYVEYHMNKNTIQNDLYSIGKIINFILTKKPNSFSHQFKEISLKCIKKQYSNVSEIKREFNLAINKE